MQQLSARSVRSDLDPVTDIELTRRGSEVLSMFGAEFSEFVTVEQKARHINLCMVALADCVAGLTADLYTQNKEEFNRIHGIAERYMYHIEVMLVDFSMSVEEDYKPPTFAHIVWTAIFSFVNDKMNNIRRGFLKNAHDRKARLEAINEYKSRMDNYSAKIRDIIEAQIVMKQKELLANNEEYQKICRDLITLENGYGRTYAKEDRLRALRKKIERDAYAEADRILSNQVFLAP